MIVGEMGERYLLGYKTESESEEDQEEKDPEVTNELPSVVVSEMDA
jgi:hypothetical protein